MRLRKTTVIGTMTAMVVGLTALPAAANVMTCNNTSMNGGTINGDLRVPVGAFCILDGTTVEGNVLVAREADLIADNTTVLGNVDVRADAYAEFVDSSVAGDVTGQAAFGHLLWDSEVGGDFTTRRSAFLLHIGGSVGGGFDVVGNVDARTEALIESVAVAGGVNTNRTDFTDVFDSTVAGEVTIARSFQGSILCDSEVDGTATFLLGVGLLDIGDDNCGAMYFGDDLVIDRHDGAPVVTNSIIRGDLVCLRNATAPTLGADVRVRGDLTGQCEGLASAAAMSTMSRSATADADVAEDRKAAILDAIEDRRTLTERETVGALSIEGEPVEMPESIVEDVRESRLDEARSQANSRR